MLKATTIILTVLLLLGSCKPQVPGRYIQPGDMEDLLYDYHLAQGAAVIDEDMTSDYKRRLYFLAVLEKHGVTEAEFDSSMVYYYSHADRMAKIYHNLEERMEAAAQKIGANGGMRVETFGTSGDTANVWNGPRSKVLMARPLNNRLDFKITADTSYHANDMLQLYFMSSFLYQEGTKDAVALIAVKYDGDTIVSRYQRVLSSGETRLTINERNDRKIKEISGFIYLGRGSGDSKTLKLMVVDKMQLVRFHQKTASDEKKDGAAASAAVVKKDSLRADTLRADSLKTAPRTIDRKDIKPMQDDMPDRPENTPDRRPHRMLQGPKAPPVRSGAVRR